MRRSWNCMFDRAAYLHRARYRNSGNWSGLLLYDGFSAWGRACLSVLPAPG